jgi:hypothetical protein
MSNKRYDVLTDIGAKLFVMGGKECVIGMKNFLEFLDNEYETKKVNNSNSNHLSQPAKVRLENLQTEFDNRKIVNDVSDLSDDYKQLKSIDEHFAKSLSSLASLEASGSLESVGNKSLFASVNGNNTFTGTYINKSQLSKLN